MAYYHRDNGRYGVFLPVDHRCAAVVVGDGDSDGRWADRGAKRLGGGLPVLDSGRLRATQRPGRWRRGRHSLATREADEPPGAADLPGAAQLIDVPRCSGMGAKLPGPFRGDGLGNHRVHDILLACGPPCSDAAIDIVLEGYDSSAAPNSSVDPRIGDRNRAAAIPWGWITLQLYAASAWPRSPVRAVCPAPARGCGAPTDPGRAARCTGRRPVPAGRGGGRTVASR